MERAFILAVDKDLNAAVAGRRDEADGVVTGGGADEFLRPFSMD